MANRNRLRLGVIVDRMTLTNWQADALRHIADESELLVYNCTNKKLVRRRPRHAAYYLLNLFTVRNRMSRRRAWPAELKATAVREFEAVQDGSWQALPRELLQQMRDDRLDAIVKFGMGLLRVPPAEQLASPILSYHHGDPAHFRGRPAGFYEMQSGRPVMGQVVQRLSNRLDAGEIVAFAETKVSPHSYRATLVEAYRHSPLILKKAVNNSIAGRSWNPAEWGRAYRLPSNVPIVKFLLKQWRNACAHLLYGLFKEKQWKVATVAVSESPTLKSVQQSLADPANWRTIETPFAYRFLADPFFYPAGGLLVEGFNSRSCRGEILHVGGDGVRRVSDRGGHFSYPAPYYDGEQWFVVPEISEWSSPKIFGLRDSLIEAGELRIPGREPLLDPTPFRHGGSTYLFANLATEGPSVLRLWTAEKLNDEFTEHPSSPVRLSPHGARMAGGILALGGDLVRVGQDLGRDYGDGLCFFRIKHIGLDRYEEEWVGDFRFGHCKGPHTFNIRGNQVAFDYYVDRFSLLAGMRRFRERRAARSPE